jgi:flagellar biosynthesis/type III secretory pathway protein FliH
MFERGMAIREAKKAEIREKSRQEGRQEGFQEGREEGREEGRQEEIQRTRALLESHGVSLPPELASAIFGGANQNGS